jgi:hypothetical protein
MTEKDWQEWLNGGAAKYRDERETEVRDEAQKEEIVKARKKFILSVLVLLLTVTGLTLLLSPNTSGNQLSSATRVTIYPTAQQLWDHGRSHVVPLGDDVIIEDDGFEIPVGAVVWIRYDGSKCTSGQSIEENISHCHGIFYAVTNPWLSRAEVRYYRLCMDWMENGISGHKCYLIPGWGLGRTLIYIPTDAERLTMEGAWVTTGSTGQVLDPIFINKLPLSFDE